MRPCSMLRRSKTHKLATINHPICGFHASINPDKKKVCASQSNELTPDK
jgi:hypothetical protein